LALTTAEPLRLDANVIAVLRSADTSAAQDSALASSTFAPCRSADRVALPERADENVIAVERLGASDAMADSEDESEIPVLRLAATLADSLRLDERAIPVDSGAESDAMPVKLQERRAAEPWGDRRVSSIAYIPTPSNIAPHGLPTTAAGTRASAIPDATAAAPAVTVYVLAVRVVVPASIA
jgi:hypothetical protein